MTSSHETTHCNLLHWHALVYLVKILFIQFIILLCKRLEVDIDLVKYTYKQRKYNLTKTSYRNNIHSVSVFYSISIYVCTIFKSFYYMGAIILNTLKWKQRQDLFLFCKFINVKVQCTIALSKKVFLFIFKIN